MSFINIVSRKISYHSPRSFSRVILRIAVVAVALSLATMIITVGLVRGFQSEIKHKVANLASHIMVSKGYASGNFDFQPMPFSKGLLDSLSNFPDVQEVRPFAFKAGLIKTDSIAEGVVLKGMPLHFDTTILHECLEKGRVLHLDTGTISPEVVISRPHATKLGLDVGDTLNMYFLGARQSSLKARRLRVVGIYSTGIVEFDELQIYADLREVLRLNSEWEPNQVAGYEIILKSYDNIIPISKDIRIFPSFDPDVEALTIFERLPQIFDWLGLLNMHIVIILSLMAIVATINIISALIIMILERTATVGLFVALGAKPSAIRAVFLRLGLRLFLRGMLFGNLFGIGLLLIQKYTGLIELDPQDYYIRELPVSLDILAILTINVGAIILAAFAMLLPLLMLRRIKPAQALRFQ